MNRLEKIINEVLSEEKEKRDRCLRIADRKFDKPSAYKSGAVVRCRKGGIWKGLKEGKQLDESKQVGTIYHYTTFEAGLKILQSNQLKSDHTADSTNSKPVFGISFTRDKRFNNGNRAVDFTNSSFGRTPQLRFTIDGNQLSNKFKVQPYSQGGVFDKGKKSFEAEERVISDKTFMIPLSDYLISVDVLVEYKKPKDGDWDAEFDYKEYAPIRAKIIKFAQDKNLLINLIINKNGDPWPDKVKPTLINKILSWFKIKEADNPQSGKAAPYGSGYARLKEEVIQEKVKETLRTWFSRKGAPGKKGGWVDCNSPIRKDGEITGYKSCGREKGEERSKYPSCRPTAAQCKTPGKGTKWGKTK